MTRAETLGGMNVFDAARAAGITFSAEVWPEDKYRCTACKREIRFMQGYYWQASTGKKWHVECWLKGV